MRNNKDSYLADYDILKGRTDEEKIEWMEGRVKRVFIKPVKKFIRSNENTDLALGMITLICCVIEALGHLRRGCPKQKIKGYDEAVFRVFIKDYLPEVSKISGKLYKHFRCGMAHAFVIERGSIEGKIANLYEAEKRKQSFYKVNPWKLFDLLEKGISNYFSDLRDKNRYRLRSNFMKRFNYSYKFWIENTPNKIQH